MKARPNWSNFSLLLLTIITLVLASCSFIGGTNSGIKSEIISINFKRSGWKKIEADLADFAFKHSSTNAIILINSLCRKYDRTSLEQLTDNLLAGLQNAIVKSQQARQLFARASLRTYASGKLDGVMTSMLIEVVKRDRCIYDFALVSDQNQITQDQTQAFDALLSSVTLEHQ